MKARLVEDTQHFERGQNPKAAMGIGGIILEKEKQERLNKMREEQKEAEVIANQDWDMYLQETLIGKKITAKMSSLPTLNVKTNLMSGTRETRVFTIVVEDISTDNLGDLLLNIVIADTEHKMYNLSLNQKISIE